jgi:hypothetical protein
MKKSMFGLGLCLALVAPAAAEDKAPIEGYTRTGETENCLTINRIKESRILGKNQILFEMLNNDRYVSEPENCNLRKSYTLKYDATINELCTTTIVTLLDNGGGGLMNAGGCGLAPFEKLAKTEAAP